MKRKATSRMKRLGSFWKQRSIPTRVKLKVYTMPQLPVFFCMDAKPVRSRHQTSSDWIHSTEDIRRISSHQKTEIINQRRRLKWLGHVLHMPPEAIPNAMLEFVKESWKRPAGRMEHTWRNLVQKELTPHLKPPRMKMKT